MRSSIAATVFSVFAISVANADETTTPEPTAPTPTREEFDRLREQVEQLREELGHTEQRVDKLAPLAARLTGYLDVGFFVVGGDGAGVRSDLGHRVFPEYAGLVPDSWVFLGDPLSTAINARGEPASAGDSRAIAFDPIHSKGPTFLINTLNVGLFAEVARNTIVTAKLDLVPRGRDVSDPGGLFLGDFVDIRLAYAEYRIARKWIELSLFAGKIDGVLGYEYRTQEAPARIEVTPSLICRYTCGSPIGVKARGQLLDGALGIALAVTNGTHFSEGFPFHDEVDANAMKTVAGRLAYAPRGARGLEFGVSGTVGAQDGQPASDVVQWMYGADVHYHRHDLVLRAEYVRGRAAGASEAGEPACGVSPCLRFTGAYGLAGYRVTNRVMPYLRVDWRDALHRNGASFVYVSQLLRATPGVRLALTENLTVKAEYTHDRELGPIPQLANDVFTSSVVVTY